MTRLVSYILECPEFLSSVFATAIHIAQLYYNNSQRIEITFDLEIDLLFVHIYVLHEGIFCCRLLRNYSPSFSSKWIPCAYAYMILNICLSVFPFNFLSCCLFFQSALVLCDRTGTDLLYSLLLPLLLPFLLFWFEPHLLSFNLFLRRERKRDTLIRNQY